MSESTPARVQRWLDRLRAKDAAAADELIAATCHRLELMARKALKGFPGVRRWEQTPDVLQNALLRLHRALKARAAADRAPATAREFFALAAGLIRRELIDLLRHYYGPLGHGAHYDSERRGPDGTPLPAAPPDLSREPARLARWTQFHECVDRLGPEEHEVFALVWYQGLTLKEVAQVLDVSERTVKRRWREARLKLRAAFAGDLME